MRFFLFVSFLVQLSFVEILEERNGRSKGCAIAEFRTRSDAEKCVKNMSPSVSVNGRNVIVKEIRVSFYLHCYLMLVNRFFTVSGISLIA